MTKTSTTSAATSDETFTVYRKTYLDHYEEGAELFEAGKFRESLKAFDKALTCLAIFVRRRVFNRLPSQEERFASNVMYFCQIGDLVLEELSNLGFVQIRSLSICKSACNANMLMGRKPMVVPIEARFARMKSRSQSSRFEKLITLANTDRLNFIKFPKIFIVEVTTFCWMSTECAVRQHFPQRMQDEWEMELERNPNRNFHGITKKSGQLVYNRSLRKK